MPKLQNPPLLQAGLCLTKYLDVTRAHGAILPIGAQQEIMDAVLGFLTLRRAAGIPWRPKMHQMVHLARQCATHGNPRIMAATWIEEGRNRDLAAVCGTAHASIWSRR
eukprot:5552806-Alexandrium_andersonii.AAC.1